MTQRVPPGVDYRAEPGMGTYDTLYYVGYAFQRFPMARVHHGGFNRTAPSYYNFHARDERTLFYWKFKDDATWQEKLRVLRALRYLLRQQGWWEERGEK